MEYTTAEFRRSMAEAFETARFQDTVVQIMHHGRPWVSIVSPESASTISRLNSIGRIRKSDLGRVLETFEEDLGLDELIDRLSGHRTSESHSR